MAEPINLSTKEAIEMSAFIQEQIATVIEGWDSCSRFTITYHPSDVGYHYTITDIQSGDSREISDPMCY